MTRDELVHHIENNPVGGSPEEMRESFRHLTEPFWKGVDQGERLKVRGVECALYGRAGRGTVLHFHGGGLVFGDLDTHRALAVNLAEASGWRVILAHLPPAPETPWAEQKAIALDLAREITSVRGPFVLSGDSAGGYAALQVALELPEPWAGLALLSPNTTRDYELVPSRFVNGDRDVMIDPETDDRLARLAFGEVSALDPSQNIHLCELQGLPPMFISVGTEEVLRDDALLLTQTAASQRVPLTLSVTEGFHLEEVYASTFAPGRRRLQRAGAFIAGLS